MLTFAGALSWFFCAYVAWTIPDSSWTFFLVTGLLTSVVAYLMFIWNPDTGFEPRDKEEG
jgi:hypothetical protein